MAGISTLTDNFSGARDATKWNVTTPFDTVDAGVTVSQSGGQLSITTHPIDATARYNGYTSVNTYDLTNDAAYIQVLATDSGHDNLILLGVNGGDYSRMICEGTTLYWQTSAVTVGSVAYSSTTHAWWRIRHGTGGGGGGSGDTLYWDTAPDSSGTPGTWVQRATSARSTITVNPIRVTFEAGSFTGPEPSGTCTVDNFNVIVPISITASESVALGDAPPMSVLLGGQYALERPTADLSSGLWTPSSGGSLFGMLNETTADASTFDTSSLAPAGDTFEVSLGNAPVAIDLNGMPGVLNYQYSGSVVGGRRVDLTVVLLCNSTPVQTWTLPAIQSTFVIAPLQLSSTGLAAIVPGGALSLRTTATQI